MIFQKPFNYDSNLLLPSKKIKFNFSLLSSSTFFTKKKSDSHGTFPFFIHIKSENQQISILSITYSTSPLRSYITDHLIKDSLSGLLLILIILLVLDWLWLPPSAHHHRNHPRPKRNSNENPNKLTCPLFPTHFS